MRNEMKVPNKWWFAGAAVVGVVGFLAVLGVGWMTGDMPSHQGNEVKLHVQPLHGDPYVTTFYTGDSDEEIGATLARVLNDIYPDDIESTGEYALGEVKVVIEVSEETQVAGNDGSTGVFRVTHSSIDTLWPAQTRIVTDRSKKIPFSFYCDDSGEPNLWSDYAIDLERLVGEQFVQQIIWSVVFSPFHEGFDPDAERRDRLVRAVSQARFPDRQAISVRQEEWIETDAASEKQLRLETQESR